MTETRTFTQCPECGTPFTAKGMGRHRTAKHGVAPETPKAMRVKSVRVPLAERLRRIEAGEI